MYSVCNRYKNRTKTMLLGWINAINWSVKIVEWAFICSLSPCVCSLLFLSTTSYFLSAPTVVPPIKLWPLEITPTSSHLGVLLLKEIMTFFLSLSRAQKWERVTTHHGSTPGRLCRSCCTAVSWPRSSTTLWMPLTLALFPLTGSR